MMLKRTAKSCGSDAPMPASSLREAAQATVSNKHGHREEHEVSRIIAQGRPVCSGEPVVTTLVCFIYFAREAMGALATRLSLRPLFSERRNNSYKTRAPRAARMRRFALKSKRAPLSVVIARLDRAIQYSTGVSNRTERPRHTGYPACAGYDGCWWRRASGFCRHCEERSDEAIHFSCEARWIASRSLSSGARSRDRLARNDGVKARHTFSRHRPA